MRGTSFLLLVLTAVAAGQSPEEAGVRLFREGRFVEAEQALGGVSTPRGKTFLALTQAATQRCVEARPQLERSFAGSHAELRRLSGLALARCAIAEQRFDAATPPLYSLREQFPDDPDVLYEVARLHLKAWDGAVETMFERAPQSFRVNQLSAEIFELQGRFDEAVAEYRKAIEKAPRSLNLHYRLGRALLMRSHEPEALAEARREFEAELALNPRDAVAEYQVAQILDVEQKPAEAKRCLERAVELDPGFAEALVALARARMRDKENDAAVELLERAVEIQPESEAALYSLMLAYRNAGRRDDALETKKRLDALEQAPEGEFNQFLERIGEQPKP